MGLKTKMFFLNYMCISVVGYVLAPREESLRIDSHCVYLFCYVPQGALVSLSVPVPSYVVVRDSQRCES